ncbi:MAG: glucose-6-phosphate dehydrogenase [Acidobacteriia bacterium]|nr:glucose-6-phosphate dehydrogenase [Terriglobia bacterium]
MSRSPEPCVMVIFGGSGDLTRRKLVPALYNLSQGRAIPGGFTILALSRSPLGDDQYREKLRQALAESGAPLEASAWEAFARGIHYLSADYHGPETYQEIKKALAEYDVQRGTGGNRIYYLATAPSDYVGIIQNLGAAGLAREHTDGGAWTRIIIEKPFGRDLESALALNKVVVAHFREDQAYRIDHYLGKETVQNILVLRFANGIFEPIWNRQYVDSVQITAAENIGVGTRGSYYEEAGALRDMIQNHVMQLLTLVAMEPPPDFAPNTVRDEKAKVLRSIHPTSADEVEKVSVRAQYGPGFIAGKPTAGYQEETNVSPQSGTETFAAIRFTIDNWRWADVPFYVRTGKNLAKQVTEIAILFRRTPHFIFRQSPVADLGANVLALRIQPNEGITLKFVAKLPGQSVNIQPVNMDFRYGSTFGIHLASAYERLLLDCMLGDPTLFNRADSVEAAWSLVQPFLDVWSSHRPAVIPTYASGSWGPPEADFLLEREHRRWRLL